MVNGKLYNLLIAVRGLLIGDIKDSDLDSTNKNSENKKCVLECASYDLIKNVTVNKKALENSNYAIIRRMRTDLKKSYIKAMGKNV